MSEKIRALQVAEEIGLYLKMVVSCSSFQNYNSFFNIYDEFEEPCRRILVFTPYKDLEEVIEENPSEPIQRFKEIDGNVWLEEYPLTHKPENVRIEEVYISKNEETKLKKIYNKRK